MGNKNKAIDAYIAKSADFAKPILLHFRDLVHEVCPAVEEKIKWGFPHFDYKGEMMCSMAAFKQHCAIGFWKGSMIKSLAKTGSDTIGNMVRMKIIRDLPSDKKMLIYIKEAMKLNEDGIKLPAKQVADKKELVIPDYFRKALIQNKKALQVFENFSYSHRKEYLQWITGAKTEETRNKRMATTIEWLSEGKGINWRYERK